MVITEVLLLQVDSAAIKSSDWIVLLLCRVKVPVTAPAHRQHVHSCLRLYGLLDLPTTARLSLSLFLPHSVRKMHIETATCTALQLVFLPALSWFCACLDLPEQPLIMGVCVSDGAQSLTVCSCRAAALVLTVHTPTLCGTSNREEGFLQNCME